MTAVDRQTFANQLDRWLTTAKPRSPDSIAPLSAASASSSKHVD